MALTKQNDLVFSGLVCDRKDAKQTYLILADAIRKNNICHIVIRMADRGKHFKKEKGEVL